MSSVTDRIEKRILLNAPVSKVWQALTDHKQFGAWFQAAIETPFVPGKLSKARNLYPGFEMDMVFLVQKIEPETHFSYRWHPFPIDAKVEYAKEEMTLVEFRLEPSGTGTMLTVVESGFDKVPAARRAEAFRMHEGGWSEQLRNIERFIGKNLS